jgi:hypothetical protein
MLLCLEFMSCTVAKMKFLRMSLDVPDDELWKTKGLGSSGWLLALRSRASLRNYSSGIWDTRVMYGDSGLSGDWGHGSKRQYTISLDMKFHIYFPPLCQVHTQVEKAFMPRTPDLPSHPCSYYCTPKQHALWQWRNNVLLWCQQEEVPKD